MICIFHLVLLYSNCWPPTSPLFLNTGHYYCQSDFLKLIFDFIWNENDEFFSYTNP